MADSDASPPPTMSHAQIVAALEAHYPRLKGLVRDRMMQLTKRPLDQLTDSPTVHTDDVCMALLQQRQPFRDTEHLMAIATLQCTRIVVDYLRRRGRVRRGGGQRGVSLSAASGKRPGSEGRAGGLGNPARNRGSENAEPDVALEKWHLREGINDALSRLAKDHPRVAQVLMLNVFMDLTIDDVAGVLELSTATVERDLREARVYLRALLMD